MLQITETVIDDADSIQVLRIDIAIATFGYLCTCGALGLDLLMLYSYYRFGTKLSQQASQIVRDELSNLMHESQDSSENRERLAYKRRFEVYKEIAD